MKFRIILIVVFLIMVTTLYSQTKNIVIVDTPTANTISRGMYNVSFLAYDNGGVGSKVIVGIFDNFYGGISLDLQNLLGKDNPQWNNPVPVARFRLTEGWKKFPAAIAIGFDTFYVGSEGRTYNVNNELNRMIAGPYFVFTIPIYLFDEQQFINYGMRVPTVPDYVADDASYFLSLDVPIGENFNFKYEFERIYWNFKRHEDFMYNVAFRYSYMDHLGVEIGVLFQEDEKPNRILRIEYNAEF